MAKNRNKTKKNGSTPMDTTDHTVEIPQAMDTSESAAPIPSSGALNSSRLKKGVPMKRTKNIRKMKAVAKAISQNEKSIEKISKNESKKLRTKSGKLLYD